jgi:hypothetical protein
LERNYSQFFASPDGTTPATFERIGGMGKRGDGYGSDDHLRVYLASARGVLDEKVSAAISRPGSPLTWLEFPRTATGDRELRGIEFLLREEHREVYEEWRKFWPVTGQQQKWDAVARSDNEWLLFEAKSNQPEFCSGPTTAKKEGGLGQLTRSLGRVKRDLGVHRYFTWTGTYYQYTNRLAMLWFLQKHDVPACLLFVYFFGDRFPDGTPCPASESEWEALLEARRLTLGLPKEHALSPLEHHVFLPTPGASEAAEGRLRSPLAAR